MQWTSIYNKKKPFDGSICVVVDSNKKLSFSTFKNGMFDVPNVVRWVMLPFVPVLNEEQEKLEEYWESGRAHEDYLRIIGPTYATVEGAIFSVTRNDSFLEIIKRTPPNAYKILKKLASKTGIIHSDGKDK